MKMKRLLAVLLGLITFVSCFATTGCNNSGVSNEQKQNALIIEYYKAGYGELWIQKLAAAYTEKYGQEVITLPRSGDQGIENMSTTFHSGASETDLFFTKGANFAELYKGGQASNNYYTDITDVYDATIDGEGVKVKDKMYDAFEEFYKMPAEGKYYDDKYYFFGEKWWGIIRPTLRYTDAKPTEESLNRINNMQKIYAEKQTTATVGHTVKAGDEITYTFSIENRRETDTVVEIVEKN